MATLVLTAVGTALGGPLGGLLGAAAGQAIDARWLTPGGRRGPRLSDLRVQTSSYGTAIPRLYGRMRVAGTVIWSTDLIEQRQRRSAGKGQPKATTYSYSASFAVALSSRPIVSVRRIWADGNILRGSDGAFADNTVLRVHLGTEDQPADPLIASAEGMGAAPAYRGVAYAVFEALDLSAFGNRIPSLTFEIEADDGPVTLATPAEDVLVDLLQAEAPVITGYALTGGSRRDAIAPLAGLLPISRRPGAGWQVLHDLAAAVVLPGPAGLSEMPQAERRTGAADRLPHEVAVVHFDPARDFQNGVQVASQPGGNAAGLTLDLPVAADAPAARALADRESARLRGAQRGATWPAGLAGLAMEPGALVVADGAYMRVRERRIEGGIAGLALEGFAGLTMPLRPADGGRTVHSPDLPTGETVAALFDLPALAPSDIDQVRLVLAAGGTGAGWRRAGVSLSPYAGAAVDDVGVVQAVAMIGQVAALGGNGTAALCDDASWIEVSLARDDMALHNADDVDLLAGANLAMAGSELLQFGHVEPLGARRWRLTRLLRGRFGSGLGTAVGAPFCLLDDPALLPMGDGARTPQIGGAVMIAATGTAAAISLPIEAAGGAQKPLAPVHLNARWQADGGLNISWVRRSRQGFAWRDGVDVPLDAGVEAYRLRLIAGTVSTAVETSAPTWIVAATDITHWRAAGATMLSVEVAQIGALALSDPHNCQFPL